MAKEIARVQFKKPTLLEALARWWEKKYRLPSNHELFQERTIFDLLVEYYVDRFEEKPIEAQRNEQGEIQFTDTGDDLIDKWEAQIAKGETPDLTEAFDDESLTHIRKLKQAAIARDPYQGLSMKSAFDKIQREATREGLHIGRNNFGGEALTPEKQKLLEHLFNNPTFGGDID